MLMLFCYPDCFSLASLTHSSWFWPEVTWPGEPGIPGRDWGGSWLCHYFNVVNSGKSHGLSGLHLAYGFPRSFPSTIVKLSWFQTAQNLYVFLVKEGKMKNLSPMLEFQRLQFSQWGMNIAAVKPVELNGPLNHQGWEGRLRIKSRKGQSRRYLVFSRTCGPRWGRRESRVSRAPAAVLVRH